jgi:hypothetical protein
MFTNAKIYYSLKSIRKIVEEIVSLEKSDVRLALVEYRDHPPQESTFVTRSHDFTNSVQDMKNWLLKCSAQGGMIKLKSNSCFNLIQLLSICCLCVSLYLLFFLGGDTPEAVADGLKCAVQLSWRNKSTKICVLISDGNFLQLKRKFKKILTY